ncbi:MAG TPA: tetratricopeptide repeat protein, partial [Gemmatimonadales bacterium]|nr:tetratricopeptide repeat protein [Gemmatimonadales bacterium]
YLSAMGRLREAMAEADLSVELDPASVSIQRSAGWVHYYARNPELGLPRLRRALVMNPESPDNHLLLGILLTHAGRLTEAREALSSALDFAPEDTHTLQSLAHVAGMEGRRDEAEAMWPRFEELAARRYVSPTDFARLALTLRRFDDAFEWLDQARDERRGWLVYLRVDPLFDSIRGDPRFAELLRAMRLG